ncbi:hypothetical protein C8R44DRAFT_865345 [Mycena epipterygia]|nr:hypothetical protein C8R44DRAFT_865345 [Mycena epipterygia]
MAFIPHLPLDLLRPIVVYNDTQSLLCLCLVSKNFLHEAQPRLYADVALRSPAVADFCRTITTVPALALHVQRLSVQLANSFSATDELACVLRALTALYALEITAPNLRGAWAPTAFYEPGAHEWAYRFSANILRGCTFKLTEFGSSFSIRDREFVAFLQQQPALEELVSFDTGLVGNGVLPAGCLPALRRVRSAVVNIAFEPELKADACDETAQGTRRVFRQELMDIETPSLPLNSPLRVTCGAGY